jgi:hypothetical protein
MAGSAPRQRALMPYPRMTTGAAPGGIVLRGKVATEQRSLSDDAEQIRGGIRTEELLRLVVVIADAEGDLSITVMPENA